MDIETTKLLLIEALAQPEGTAVDYLISKQKESHYRLEAFIKLLYAGINYWKRLVTEINDNSPIRNNSLKIPLLTHTKAKFTGHLGYQEIETLITFIEGIKRETIKHSLPPPPETNKHSDAEPKEVAKINLGESKRLKDMLTRYGFYKFLQEKNLNETKIENLIFNNKIPFRIALLSEIGFLKYFKKEFCKDTCITRDKILGEIFGVSHRRIRGNINVLSDKTEENKETYTSHEHITNIRKLIKGL